MAETDTVVARLRAKKTQYGSHVGEYEIDASDLEIEAADLIAKLMNRVTEAEAAREAAEAKAARLREAAAELRRIAHRYLAQFSGVQRDVYAVADRIDAALAQSAAPVAPSVEPEWVPDIPGSAWPAEDEGCE